MRLDRLDLTRYGRFTDAVIEFPAPSDGAQDIHIIYGPNEAGKSTLFAAWLDLLFGIPQQTGYSFLHAGPAMEIGATISTGQGKHDVRRRKGRGTTLYNSAGDALPEGTLQAALGGLSREGYSAMFSLDDETLERGGESILSSGGELGQLLFSASAGLSGLSAQVDQLRDALDGFYRKGKRSGGLYDGKKRLDELAKSARTLEVSASEQKRRSRALDDAMDAWESAKTHEILTNRQLAATRGSLGALPLIRRLSETAARLDSLAALPDVGAAETDTLAALQEQKNTLDAQGIALSRQAQALEDRLAHVTLDPQVLGLEPVIAEAEAWRAEHDTALNDLPRRQHELENFEFEIATLCRELGQPDSAAADLIVTPVLLAQMRGLLNQRSGLQMALKTASIEAANATTRLNAEMEKQQDSGNTSDADATGQLTILLARLATNDPAQLLRQRIIDHDKATIKMQQSLDDLLPWRGDADDLAALMVPSHWQIENWRALVDATRQEERDAQRALKQLSEQHQALDARLSAADDTVMGIAISDVAAARLRREALWRAHLDAMTSASATAFEVGMREDDQFSALMSDAIARRQSIEKAQDELHDMAQNVAHAQRDLADATTACADLAATIAASVASLGLEDAGLPALVIWLDHRITALAARDELRTAAVDLSRAKDEAAAAAGSLATALGKPAACTAADFEALYTEALALQRNAERRREIRERLRDLKTDAQRRREEKEAARGQWDDWCASWDLATADTVLASEPHDSAAIADMLDRLERLATKQGEAQGIAHRISAMTKNRDRFMAAKAEVLAAIEMPETSAWDEVASRAQNARAAKAEWELIQKQRSEQDAQTHALADDSTRLLVAQRQFAARLDCPPDSDLLYLQRRLADRIEASGLREEAARLSQDLQRTGRDPENDSQNEAELQVAEQHLSAAFEEARKETERLQGLASDARHALNQVGGDDALARIVAERENLRLSLQDQAREHLRRKFGLIALDTALRRYREEHQSAMLDTASAAFATLSQGAYPALSVQPSGQSDRLVAVARDGRTRMAADMSKGTRFQLYLALRVAGYHELAKSRPAIPFIADDIMETFDDGRAAAAFTLLSQMSRSGQVIYLTHHQHLCQIARDVCPSVNIIDLQTF